MIPVLITQSVLQIASRKNSNDKKSWVAIPLTPVRVGDEVKVAGGMIMSNFTSKTLNRTFEAIIFSKGIVQ